MECPTGGFRQMPLEYQPFLQVMGYNCLPEWIYEYHSTVVGTDPETGRWKHYPLPVRLCWLLPVPRRFLHFQLSVFVPAGEDLGRALL